MGVIDDFTDDEERAIRRFVHTMFEGFQSGYHDEYSLETTLKNVAYMGLIPAIDNFNAENA